MSIENPSFENEPKKDGEQKIDWSLADTTSEKDRKALKEESKKPNKSIDEVREEMNLENRKNLEIIKQQEYEKVKKAAERFKKEHGIKKSEEELEKEDKKLRKQFGLE